ncbi:helix-turn-helix domain-containing protein [Bacillus sp. 37MA]|uniref:helix-turn-helix domain-containing protein n=1 Tax=Bacillus sp. 37MA TaxID=1132442 RepID=UPI00035E21DD|nr:helix-turn-helix domain-containing protein [Bacillus sp. 37MA]
MNKPDYYTTKEAAAILDKATATIHKYIRDGKLTPIEDHWGGHRGKLFKKEAVEKLKEELADDMPGMTMSESADYLKITRSILQSYLDEHLIPFQKQTWRNKSVTFIQRLDLDTFKTAYRDRLLDDRLKQRTFYDRKNKQAFYQRFSSPSINEARLIRYDSGKWGFFIPLTGLEMGYEEGIFKHELTSDYEVSFGKRTGTPGYAKISLPLHYSLTRKFIDVLYKQCAISNLYMEIHEDKQKLTIYMKDAVLTDTESAESIGHLLENNIEDGYITANHQHIRIESSEKNLSIHLPYEIKKKIKELADEQGTSMQVISSQIIENYFSQQNKEEVDPVQSENTGQNYSL